MDDTNKFLRTKRISTEILFAFLMWFNKFPINAKIKWILLVSNTQICRIKTFNIKHQKKKQQQPINNLTNPA